MITYQIEDPHVALTEVRALIEKHWDEMQGVKTYPLQPDWLRYKALFDVGRFRVATVRRDGVMMGYLMVLVVNSIKTQREVAVSDGFWVKPCWMRGIMIRGMARKMVEHLRSIGVTVFDMESIPGKDIGPLLEGLGFVKSKVSYSLELEKSHA